MAEMVAVSASALPPPNGARLAKPCVRASNCRWSTATPAERNAAAYSLPSSRTGSNPAVTTRAGAKPDRSAAFSGDTRASSAARSAAAQIQVTERARMSCLDRKNPSENKVRDRVWVLRTGRGPDRAAPEARAAEYPLRGCAARPAPPGFPPRCRRRRRRGTGRRLVRRRGQAPIDRPRRSRRPRPGPCVRARAGSPPTTHVSRRPCRSSGTVRRGIRCRPPQNHHRGRTQVAGPPRRRPVDSVASAAGRRDRES